MSSQMVYSATTGQKPVGSYVEENLKIEGDLDDSYMTDPFCFVCGRATDHFAEHDDLVEQGKARYNSQTGDVYRVTTEKDQA